MIHAQCQLPRAPGLTRFLVFGEPEVGTVEKRLKSSCTSESPEPEVQELEQCRQGLVSRSFTPYFLLELPLVSEWLPAARGWVSHSAFLFEVL